MEDISKLLELCKQIAGITIYDLTTILNVTCPTSLKSNKGWIGQLIESYLGVKINNLPTVDFPHLGLELKTIPINIKTLTPTESTYICTAPINDINLHWEKSVVYQKLSKVLWVPIESSAKLNLYSRRIGKPFLWQPNKKQAMILKNDWYELTEILRIGKLGSLSAKYGKYLQIRPKAANCKVKLINYKTIDEEHIKTVARGFYLRANFTKQILAKFFAHNQI